LKCKMLLLILVVAMLSIGGSVLPALAAPPPSDTPPSAPVCDWNFDRYLWNNYGYELWAYTCDYGDDNGSVVTSLWNPDEGYLTQR
jgi:hypothetical protein